MLAHGIGRLAQLVEHFVYTEGVGGSNPSPPTSLRSRSEEGCRAEARRAKAGYCIRELRLGKPGECSHDLCIYSPKLGKP